MGQLVEGEGLSSVAHDSLSCCLGELEGGDLEALGGVQESVVVGDCAHHCDDWGVLSALEVLGDSGEREGVSVESGLVESSEDDFVERAVGSSGEEGVQLSGRRDTLMRSLR